MVQSPWVHQTLKTTPAVKAGIADRKWTIEDMVNLIPEKEPTKRGSYKKADFKLTHYPATVKISPKPFVGI